MVMAVGSPRPGGLCCPGTPGYNNAAFASGGSAGVMPGPMSGSYGTASAGSAGPPAPGVSYTGSSYGGSVGGLSAPGGMVGNSVPLPGGPCGCSRGAGAGDCNGACLGVESMCCEPAGGVQNVQWVHASGGAYSPVMSYQYVGEGSGTYNREITTSWYGWRMKRCCVAILGLLFLSSLLYLLLHMADFNTGDSDTETNEVVAISTPAPSLATMAPVDPTPPAQPFVPETTPFVPSVPVEQPTPAPTIVTPAPTPAPTVQGPAKTCLIFGDPHVKTFDGQRSDYYTSGEYWLVRSKEVKIQGRYLPTHMTNNLAVTKEVAISGDFIGGHKLIISVDRVMWDSKPVMQGFAELGATWSNANPAIHIEYNGDGTVMQDSRKGKALHVVHIQLPQGVKMEINRWHEPEEGEYINTRLTMPPQPGMDGHCGNANNDPMDDTRVAVRGRVGKNGVSQSELIFPGTKTPVNPGNRPDLNDCPEGQLKIAMEKCKAAEHAFFPSHACLIDSCLGHMAPHGM